MKSLNIIYLSLLALTLPNLAHNQPLDTDMMPGGRHSMGMGMGMGMGPGGPAGAGSMQRHRYVMQQGLDPRYAETSNPLTPDAANLTVGRTLYRQYCASCHGIDGLGDGDAGKALQPPPANLAWSTKRPIATDGYLDWTITEGGIPVHTAMPAFKAVLTERQIWQIILYLRQL
ncbi:MAG: cytochrome c [Gammaproteobacteria bacterium]|jgi:mono/diheme cytochrome c family protein|nr:cytochrome c [Gammaproteobacteria bacterium]